jgi:hypothetical protein
LKFGKLGELSFIGSADIIGTGITSIFWFFHDHIKKTQQLPDLDYLKNFEKKYQINLWKLALNERFFYMHNRFYQFTKQEILSILEQESKLFETVLDET